MFRIGLRPAANTTFLNGLTGFVHICKRSLYMVGIVRAVRKIIMQELKVYLNLADAHTAGGLAVNSVKIRPWFEHGLVVFCPSPETQVVPNRGLLTTQNFEFLLGPNTHASISTPCAMKKSVQSIRILVVPHLYSTSTVQSSWLVRY